jgi:hypothetical protein
MAFFKGYYTKKVINDTIYNNVQTLILKHTYSKIVSTITYRVVKQILKFNCLKYGLKYIFLKMGLEYKLVVVLILILS